MAQSPDTGVHTGTTDTGATDTLPGEGVAIGDMAGFHLRLAQSAVYRHFSDCLADVGLTQRQVLALWLVADQPGMAQTGLGQHMKMDRASTMAIVNRLQARGFVTRGKSPADGRKQALHITQTGADTLNEAKQAVARHEAWLKARYTSREVAVLIELLSRLHG